MIVSFEVKDNIDQVVRQIDARFARQVPFATARALTDTAKDVQRAVTDELPKVFDRPTPFTQRGVGMAWATKSSLTSRVFLKDVQRDYLKVQVAGGTRTPKGKALVIPSGVGLNAYGNIPRGRIKTLLARKDVFSGRVRGVAGIWQRMAGGGLKLLVAYEPKATYRQRFPFGVIARQTIQRRLLPNLRAALAAAIASAR